MHRNLSTEQKSEIISLMNVSSALSNLIIWLLSMTQKALSPPEAAGKKEPFILLFLGLLH